MKKPLTGKVLECLHPYTSGKFRAVLGRQVVAEPCTWEEFRQKVRKHPSAGLVIQAREAEELIDGLVTQMAHGGAAEVFGRCPAAVVIIDDNRGAKLPRFITRMGRDSDLHAPRDIVWASVFTSVPDTYDPALRYMIIQKLES